MADFAVFWPLGQFYGKRNVMLSQMKSAIEGWCSGKGMKSLQHVDEGDCVYNDKVCLTSDMLAFIPVEDVVVNRRSAAVTLARIGDSEEEITGSDFKERWRRFLACLNLFQFSSNFRFWAVSEFEAGTAPEIPAAEADLPESWQEIIEETTSGLHPYVPVLAAAEVPVPEVEYFNEHIDDDAFAEIAWENCSPPIAVLAGDQSDFASKWQNLGWKVVLLDELRVKGGNWLADLVSKSAQGE